MKKRNPGILILFVFISAILSFMAYGEDRREYTFKDLFFSIKCPADWNVRELKEGQFKDMVTILLPKDTARRKFTANMVIVSSLKEAESLSLDDLYRMNMDNMPSSKAFPEFKLKSEYKIKVGTRDAYQATFEYTHPEIGIKLKSFQIYTMTENRMFVIQYAAPKITYKKYMDEVNEVVRSFEYKK